jgi:hypothetical protein
MTRQQRHAVPSKPAPAPIDWAKPPTKHRNPFDDPRGRLSPMGFRKLPVKMRGGACEHCAILHMHKLQDEAPRRAVALMVCGGLFKLAVCSPHRAEWMDKHERDLRRETRR